jgi:uncharacterized repeat protein (TIGR01451 family)
MASLGNFYTVDANITSVSPVAILGSGTLDAKVSVAFTYTGATTSNGIAEVYFGLYLARPGDVPEQGKGATKGSSAWTGGSLQTTVEIGGSGATSIQLAPPALIDGEINGIKFHDRNGNGAQDTGDEPLAGWTIYLDLNNNKSWESGEPKTVTDANGFYTFSVIPDADRSDPDNDPYFVREEMQGGWVQTAPSDGYFQCEVSAATPQYTGLKFGNAMQAALGDFVWNDINGDGVQDLPQEQGIANVPVQLLDGSGNPISGKSTTTDANGYYSFAGLLPGSYSVQFTAPTGYAFTVPDNSANDASDSDAVSSDVDPFTGKTGVITLTSGVINNNVDAGIFEVVADFVIAKDVRSISGGNDNDVADWSGDVITYVIGMQNVGNITLTSVSVLDGVESYTGTAADYESGDTDGDGDLDVGESWLFTASYTLTQDDLDGKGGGDGFLSNIATGSANEVDPKSDSELVPLVYAPDFEIAKDVRSISGGNDNDVADWSGDVITYVIGMQNVGNITLTGVSVLDEVESYTGTAAVYESEDNDLDGDLDVGESWLFTASYTLTQDDLDGKGGGDGFLNNIATGSANEVDPKSDSELVPLVYNPLMAIDKVFTGITGGNGNALADFAGDLVNYQVTLKNSGNVTLDQISVIDQVESYMPTNLVRIGGDLDGDEMLDVDEVWTYAFSYQLTQADLDGRGGGDGYLDNTATGNSDLYGPVTDSERVPLVYQNYTTFTLGGWGSTPQGNNPGTYLQANFSKAFPGGLVVPRKDGAGADIVLSSPKEVREFLRAVKKDPFSNGQASKYVPSTLEKQFVALSLNVGFDAWDVNFGKNSGTLGNLKIHDLTGSLSVVNGLSISQVVDQVRAYLNGGTYGAVNYTLGLSAGDLTMLLGYLNEAFDNGKASDWAKMHL